MGSSHPSACIVYVHVHVYVYGALRTGDDVGEAIRARTRWAEIIKNG